MSRERDDENGEWRSEHSGAPVVRTIIASEAGGRWSAAQQRAEAASATSSRLSRAFHPCFTRRLNHACSTV